MATVYVDFTPSTTAPFQFQPVLDGQPYTAVITWNLFGQRWYITVSTVSGTLVVCQAMVGSPLDYNISLVAGYLNANGAQFTSQLVFRQANNQFEVIS